jgi:hypothetical protein
MAEHRALVAAWEGTEDPIPEAPFLQVAAV